MANEGPTDEPNVNTTPKTAPLMQNVQFSGASSRTAGSLSSQCTRDRRYTVAYDLLPARLMESAN